MDDKQIIALYFDRDENAITETAQKYGSYCYSIAYGILCCRQDAEETVNDTYMGAWRAIPPHQPEKLSAFLGKITRRLALMKWKTVHALKRGAGEMDVALEELGECISNGMTPEQEVEHKELTRRLNSFINKLPEIDQRIFVCRYWYIMPVKEIAKRFGFSESKVKSMLSRTRKKLVVFFQKEGITL